MSARTYATPGRSRDRRKPAACVPSRKPQDNETTISVWTKRKCEHRAAKAEGRLTQPRATRRWPGTQARAARSRVCPESGSCSTRAWPPAPCPSVTNPARTSAPRAAQPVPARVLRTAERGPRAVLSFSPVPGPLLSSAPGLCAPTRQPTPEVAAALPPPPQPARPGSHQPRAPHASAGPPASQPSLPMSVGLPEPATPIRHEKAPT